MFSCRSIHYYPTNTSKTILKKKKTPIFFMWLVNGSKKGIAYWMHNQLIWVFGLTERYRALNGDHVAIHWNLIWTARIRSFWTSFNVSAHTAKFPVAQAKSSHMIVVLKHIYTKHLIPTTYCKPTNQLWWWWWWWYFQNFKNQNKIIQKKKNIWKYEKKSHFIVKFMRNSARN